MPVLGSDLPEILSAEATQTLSGNVNPKTLDLRKIGSGGVENPHPSFGSPRETETVHPHLRRAVP